MKKTYIALIVIAVAIASFYVWMSMDRPELPTDTGSTSGGGGQGILPYQSGVEGLVLRGPICPVMKDPPDPNCADKPYATEIEVLRGGTLFSRGTSGEDGKFKISLPPGEYVVRASGGRVFPRCSEEAANVGSSGYTSVSISCDTGIR